MNDQKSAMLQNIAAGNSYYKLLDEQMPAALGNVKSLLSDGQKSWDAQSKSFILKRTVISCRKIVSKISDINNFVYRTIFI